MKVDPRIEIPGYPRIRRTVDGITFDNYSGDFIKKCILFNQRRLFSKVIQGFNLPHPRLIAIAERELFEREFFAL